jgi:hypothetical protein
MKLLLILLVVITLFGTGTVKYLSLQIFVKHLNLLILVGSKAGVAVAVAGDLILVVV